MWTDLRRPFRSLVLGVTLLLVGCWFQGDRPLPENASLNGIQTSGEAPGPIHWHLSSTPIRDWGGVHKDPASEFEHRNGYLAGLLRSDGSLVVIDRFRVREFDSSGEEVASFGRWGSGPSEFRSLARLCLIQGDTVAAYDQTNGRLVVVAPGGNLVSETLVRGLGVLLDSPCPGDGSALLQRANGELIRVDRFGSVLGVLGTFPKARDSDGLRTDEFLVAANGYLYSGRGSEAGFQARNIATGAVVDISLDHSILPAADPGPLAAVRFEGQSPVSRAENEAERRRAADEDRRRYFDRVLPSPTGLWLRSPLSSFDRSSSEVWSHVAASGGVEGKLHIAPPPYDSLPRDELGRPAPPPLRPRLMATTDTSVLLLRYDSNGAAHFSEYRLIVGPEAE